MAEAAPILLVAGTAMKFVGQLRQAAGLGAAAKFNQAVSSQNAGLAVKQAAEEERSYRILARKQLGDIRANIGASGVTMEGSAQDILEESAATAEMDALRIRHSGQVKATAFGNDATLYNLQGSSARQQGALSGAGTLLEGGYKGFEKGYF